MFMRSVFTRIASVGVAGAVAAVLAIGVHGQSKIACDPDNGGIKLPQGFCALVVANDVGVARHMAVAANGYLYVAHPKTIERFKMTAGQLKPTGEAEVIVKDLLPDSPQHNDKGLTFDG